jgi:hypothetical protein
MATPGVTLRHVAGTLLVADQDVPYGGVDDRVVDRQDRAARQAEHDLDALHLEALDECLCSSELHRCFLYLSVGAVRHRMVRVTCAAGDLVCG